jgi:hypothetical protein
MQFLFHFRILLSGKKSGGFFPAFRIFFRQFPGASTVKVFQQPSLGSSSTRLLWQNGSTRSALLLQSGNIFSAPAAKFPENLGKFRCRHRFSSGMRFA